MTEIEQYLRTITPRDYYLCEVLPLSHPNRSRMMGYYAVRIISMPVMITEAAEQWLSNDDIMLVEGFRQIFSADQFDTPAVANQWASTIATELRHSISQTVRYADTVDAVRDDYAEGISPVTRDLPEVTSLQNNAATRLLESGQPLYATVHPHAVFGRVLQSIDQ